MRDDYGKIIEISKHLQDNPESQSNALWIDKDTWTEETVPMRPWVAGGYLLRGSVTVISGAGAAGKSMLALGYAIALANGRRWGRFEPTAECKISIYNVEDDRDEQRRRISAALRQHDLRPAWTVGRIIRIGAVDTGTLFELDQVGIVETKAMEELRSHLEDFHPDVLIVDPLIEMHSAEENDNTALRMVVAQLRALAVRYAMAIVVLHHSRKGIPSPGDVDSVRGASAIGNAARIVLTVCVMTSEEATELNISDDIRWRFFRVDGAKSNYAPPREAEWYERVDYTLDNGEVVAAAVPWSAPGGRASPETAISLLAAIANGAGHKLPWSPRISEEARSISSVMHTMGITTKGDQKKALSLIFAGGVVTAAFREPGRSSSRAPLKGLRTQKGEPADVEWLE